MAKPRKRKAPYRFLATWHSKSRAWHQRTYPRRPPRPELWRCPYKIEDLLTGEVIDTNFDVREATYYATHDWPVKNAALRKLNRFYNPPPKKPVDRLAKLQAAEKRWLTKFRLAETKLKKIRRAMRRLNPPQHGQCGNCMDGKLLQSGEQCGICGNTEV